MSLRDKPALKRQRPITAHPLVRRALPLWLAALCGLSVMAIRGSLFAEIVRASQLDPLLGASSRVSGMAAQVLAALGMGGFGALVGMALVRLLDMTNRHDLSGTSRPEMRRPEVVWPKAGGPQGDDNRLDAAASPPETAPAVACPTTTTNIAYLPPPAPPACTAAQRIARAPLADLSYVELLERLAIGLERRRQLDSGLGGGSATPGPSAPAALPKADKTGLPHGDFAQTEATLRAALVSLRRLK